MSLEYILDNIDKILTAQYDKWISRHPNQAMFTEDVLFGMLDDLKKKELYEGLIVSYDYSTVETLLQRHLKATDIQSKTDKIIIYLKRNRQLVDNNIKMITSDRVKFVKMLRVYGWYVSKYQINILDKGKIKGKVYNKKFDASVLDDINTLQGIVVIEPRFAVKSEKVDKYLYHISPCYNKNKILRHGLTPRHKDRMFNYPSRIYCFKEGLDYKVLASKIAKYIPKETIKNTMNKHKRTLSFCVFKVNSIDVDWYVDVNMNDSLFTLENVYKGDVEFIKDFEIKI